MKLKKLLRISLLTSLISINTIANANIVIDATRVVYNSNAREVTVQLSNEGSQPSLVQTWVDDGNAKSTPNDSKAPFMITPPVSRVDPKKGQALRITALPKTVSLNKNQESLFWLNVVDIPPLPIQKNATDEPDNYLQLAVRSRIKIFFRPVGLKGDANAAPASLEWSKSGTSLNIKNPTPFHVTITEITSKHGDKSDALLNEAIMIKPFTTEKVNIKKASLDKVSFTTINDFGGNVVNELKLN